MANQWFYVQNGQQVGPVALEQLQQLLASAALPPSTQVWTEGMPQWMPADQVPGLLQPGAGGAGDAGVVPNYQGVAPAEVQGRPTSVTVLAIIGIIWSSLTLLCSVCGIVGVMFAAQQPQLQAQLAHIPKPWLIISTVLTLALAVLLLAASIGSLQLAAWARKGMLAYAVAAIAMAFLGLIMGFAYADPNQPPAVAAGIAIGQFILSLILPAFVLYFFTRPHVIGAFESSKMRI